MTITVEVRNNNVEKALRVLKKKLQKDGLMKELRMRQHFEKPSLKRQRKHKENIRRCKKEQRLKDLRS
jgi:small subunit ribosomal protein S21|tara:strand:+ start:1176 stop:1379 length:204 start_codon:yes stop_codon:yes gene_type:complete